MEYRYTVLTKREKEEIIKSLFSERNLIKDFSLTEMEIEEIKKISRSYLGLGYAIQLLFLKNRGISIISSHELISEQILKYVASQIDCSIGNFHKYWEIKNTKFRHFQEICNIFGYKKFEMTSKIERFIYNTALSTKENIEFIQKFLQELKREKLVLPSLSKIEEIVAKGIRDTNNLIYSTICEQIENKERFDVLLSLFENGSSNYSRIKNITVNNTPTGVREILKLIKEIDNYGEMIDISFLTESKIRYFYSEIQRSDRFRIERFNNIEKKYAYLAMFLYFRRKELVDMVIAITSHYANTVMKRSKKKTQNYYFKNQKKYKMNSDKLKNVVKDILEIDDFSSFKEYQNSLLELKVQLDLEDEELEEIDFLLKSHQSFNYTNELLDCIEFDSYTKPEFIRFLKIFKDQKKRKWETQDIEFFSTQWQKNIKKYSCSKKVMEIALLYSIRDNIRSGDIFVKESKNYNSFDHYLIAPIKETIPEEAAKFILKLKSTLKIPKQLEFQEGFENNEKNNISDQIYNYFPKITMTEILYEVHSWTGILENFQGLVPNSINRQKVLIATLLANGHNIGFSKMAISSSIDEAALRRYNEFYFNYDNLFNAQKKLVNYHHSLEIVQNWGSGSNSSSDGMRVPITSKTIYSDYNSHYGNKGGGIYRHISDQYTPYYVQMLEGRDSNHVLDGLLYHDTDLEIYDHSTDTAGYTEQMFALTHLLDFNFNPRIKNLNQQQLYAFENMEINDIKFKKINEKIISENYFEVMRLVESIKCGKVRASLILQKINSYNRDNGVAKGLKEIGRILKTKYILNYYTNEILRKEVQKVLNKGESINSVARLIFFGKYGRLNENSLEKQLEKVSCLNILLSSLIVWNSRYLEKVYKVIKNEEWFDSKEFQKVSPLGTQHINFLGKYIFEEKEINTEDGLRPLKVETH